MALILHNPVYLEMVQQLLYPRNVDLYALPTAKPLIKVPKFRAKVFELVTYAPEEGDTEVESEGETDNMPETSRGHTLHRTSQERELPQPKKRRVGSHEKDRAEGELMYLEEPETLSVINPKVYTENIQNVGVNYTVIENLRRVHDGDKVLEVDPQKIYPGEEEGEWDSCASSSPSPEPSISTPFLKMPMGPMTRSPLSPEPPSSTPSSPRHRDFEVPRIFVDSPEPMSGYNSDSRAPSTPSSHSSMPSLCSYSDSDDSNDAYSPLSLDELNRGNMKSKYFTVEPVRLGKGTKAALADLPNEPRYFVHRTSGANEDGNNTAFTYITCRHTDEWHPAHKFMPTENGLISPHPFSIVENQYVYQVLETFCGPIDNSPLQHVRNELVNPFNPSYDSLRGVNEYKISTLALKIYDLITELDVHLDQWRETQPRISQAELEKIRITIFRAHTKRYVLEDTGDWGRYLIMQGVADTPASTCIIAKDSSKAEIAPTP
ncbi:hypothetical protein ARMGADRAFT_1082793 [Armillaria gallica]|uniref:Uncharacterized protein n=1 Tax=Armillaria gallica TaxID=47427 RepID=A0A2H3D5M4_ARMGA|nr:hypothetical protein ARMGADRAFT_1082793 [Armillaria gallica]